MNKVFSIFLAVALLFVMSSCGGEKPEQAVTNMLEAIKNLDQEAAAKYVDYDKIINAGEEDDEAEKTDAETEEQLKAMLNKLSYEIVSTSENGNTATVETKITNIDMKTVMGEVLQQAFGLIFSGLSEEEMDAKMEEIFAAAIAAEDAETVTNTVNIAMEKKDGQWKIEASDELINAIFGGMLAMAEDLNESFGDDTTEE